jgi:hypothetical protein
MIKIEITSASKEDLQAVYDFLNNLDGLVWESDDSEGIVTIELDDDTMMHCDFCDFTELLNDLDIEWEELEN